MIKSFTESDFCTHINKYALIIWSFLGEQINTARPIIIRLVKTKLVIFNLY